MSFANSFLATSYIPSGDPNKQGPMNLITHFMVLSVFVLLTLWATGAWADIPRLPGSDEMDKMTAAGTLLRLIDSFLFKFIARLLAGLCVLTAGVSFKNQNFAVAFLCIFAAILIGTCPLWVKNIFDMGGGTIFSWLQPATLSHPSLQKLYA